MKTSSLIADMESIDETLNAINGNKKTFEKDPRQFRPNLKNEKKEYRATVRFLSQGIQQVAKKAYFIERWDHAFIENGQWYIERCPSLMNKQLGVKDHKCPACISNRRDYNSKQEVLVQRAHDRKIKKTYVTNILVIDDPQFPENNGKIMYWNMPYEIVKLIEIKWHPESKKRSPSNPYCPIKGYALDLVLKINPSTGYATYAGSEWLEPEPIYENEEEIVKLLNSTIDLDEFLSEPDKFKPFDELNNRFLKVTSGGVIVDSPMNTIIIDDKPTTALDKVTSSITTSALAADVPDKPVEGGEVSTEDDSWLED